MSTYPMTDAATGQPVDPYDEANFSRYPTWVNQDYIVDAMDIRGTITAPLPEAVIDRVYHIRSGLNTQTGARLKWEDVDLGSFNPEDGVSPVSTVAGKGDGTVPFWAARLAQTAPSHIYSAKVASDHGGLVEHEEVLLALQKLIESDQMPRATTIKAKDRTLGVEKATRKEAEDLVRDIVDQKVSATDKRANDPEIWRRLLEDTTLC
jgi:hypothetical protein